MGLGNKIIRKSIGDIVENAIENSTLNNEELYIKILDKTKKYMSKEKLDVDFDQLKTILSNKNSSLNIYLNSLINEIDDRVLKTTILNLGFEAMLNGTRTIRKMRNKYNCNIPWLILMDPTSACNLHCTGCWAAEYGNKLNLSYEEMSDIIKQGKKLGVFFYMFTGGEPLVRSKDIIKLCREHKDCAFLAYTNGTLIDQDLCEEMRDVGNLMLALSIEGEPEVNDLRRGNGVYSKVMDAMELLKVNGLVFGASICYTSKNYLSVTNPAFIRHLVNKGCRYALYFHYMPVGNSADVNLLPNPEQRIHVMNRIREIRRIENGEGLFTMDFQNDGEFVGGCIAGGRNYFHINANGDAEPCVFIHYSDSNIHDKSILEILKSPLFMAYHNNQPFNSNHFQPCPMLENPEKIEMIVSECAAKSTDLQSFESVEHLCNKCKNYAKEWEPYANCLWENKVETETNK